MAGLAGGRTGLTKALEQLTTLLPRALEEASPSQTSPVTDKLRSVLLELLEGCLAAPGKHVVAVLRILQVVLDKLPAVLAHGALYTALARLLQLLAARLPQLEGAGDEQALSVLRSLASLLAEQPHPQQQQQLLQLHADTVDLLLDLERVLLQSCFGDAPPAAGAQLCAFQGLLSSLQQQAAAVPQQAASPGGEQQQLPADIPARVQITVDTANAWEAFVRLGLRCLLFQLQDFPLLLGPLTPRVLASALGQMLSFSSARLQVLCLSVLALLPPLQPHDAGVAAAVLQHALALLEWAAEGLLPPCLMSPGWQDALAACVATCVAALAEQRVLTLHADRLVQALCCALAAAPLQQRAALWLDLLRDCVAACPQSAGTAALWLPLDTPTCASDAAAAAALTDAWRLVGDWAASPDARGPWEQQLLLLHPSLQPPSAHVAGDAAGEPGASPAKKKRRKQTEAPAKKYRQMQITVTDGCISSQRPGRPSGSSSQPSDSGGTAEASDAAAAADALAAALHAPAAQPAPPPVPAAAAAARVAALVACLGPGCRVPSHLLPALGAGSSAGTGAAAAGAAAAAGVPDAPKLSMLMRCLAAFGGDGRPEGTTVACLGQQAAAWLRHAAGHPELLPQLLPVLLAALAAAAACIAAAPRSVDVHVRVWQHAQDLLQGTTSLFSSAASARPSAMLAAVAVAWLALARLMGWGGSAAASCAAAQVAAACSSRDGTGCLAPAVLLLPLHALLQHCAFHEARQAFGPASPPLGGAGGGAATARSKAAASAASAASAGQAAQQAQQAMLKSFLALVPHGSSGSAPALRLAVLRALAWLLQLLSGPVTALTVAALLSEAAQLISLPGEGGGRSSASSNADGTAREQQLLAALSGLPLLSLQPRSSDSSAAGSWLPPLQELLPVLQPALDVAEQPRVQAAALQLLGLYLGAAAGAAEAPAAAQGTATGLAGSQPLLLAALSLVASPAAATRDAALGLVPAFLQPPVLGAAFAAGSSGGDTAADDDAPELADGLAQPGPPVSQPHKRLLLHLHAALAAAGSDRAPTAAAASEHAVACKAAVLRAMAGLYPGLAGSGCEGLLLLHLLEQVTCDHAQVSATALELLQHLACRHTHGRELEDLLLDGPAAAALLTHVGRRLHTEPQLFLQLAALIKMPESQLAGAVAPLVVPWLCCNRLQQPLELLASYLPDESASGLLVGCADLATAHTLWFKPDSFQGFVDFVESITLPAQPDCTFTKIAQALSRRIARWLVQLSGLPRFWDGQHRPPRALLRRAGQHMSYLATLMQLPAEQGTIQLLQGETIALLLKSIGTVLYKQAAPGPAAPALAAPAAAGTPAASGGGGGGSAAAAPPGRRHDTAGASAGGAASGVAAEKLQCLRALVVLMHLLGSDLGSHALQLMAVLSEALLQCTEGEPRLQALAAWQCFVQLLAAHAPHVLERVAAQAAVVLLPVLEPTSGLERPPAAADAPAPQLDGSSDEAAVQMAAAVLREMVVTQRQHVRGALRHMPPLPSLELLRDVNAVLDEEQGRAGPLQQLQLLVHSLRHESVAVRHVALGEVRRFVLDHRGFITDTLAGLRGCTARPTALRAPGAAAAAPGAPAPAAAKAGGTAKLAPAQCQELVTELLAALLSSCDNLDRSALAASMKQRCAQCLGLLGAIDPSRVQPQLPRPVPFAFEVHTFLVPLVQQHLVRVLHTVCDIAQLEVTSYALQQLLQANTHIEASLAELEMQSCCAGGSVAAKTLKAVKRPDAKPTVEDMSAPASLFGRLSEDAQSVVRPFLSTRFTVSAAAPEAPGIVFGSQPHTFRTWLRLWLKQLAMHAQGPVAAAFEACRGVTNWDQPLMLHLLPFLLAEAAGRGGAGLELAVAELRTVMQSAASGPDGAVPDISLYLQCIFTQLDLLQQWVTDQQEVAERYADNAAAAAAAGSGAAPAKPAPARAGAAGDGPLPPFVANVAALVTAIPTQTLAQAALKCGAYARALRYYESHLRQQYGGGLNPSAFGGGCTSYASDDVSFLLEVYGHLEEPDGLEGLAQLRNGGLTHADAILSAEKAGAWSEALALYEQALSTQAAAAGGGALPAPAPAAAAAAPGAGAAAADALMAAAAAVASGGAPGGLAAWQAAGQQHQDALVARLLAPCGAGGAPQPGALLAGGLVAQGVSALQLGHLRCLLQMGHHQSLLRQVDGLIARCMSQAAAAAAVPGTPAAAAAAAAAAAGGDADDAGPAGVQWALSQLAALGVAAAWRLGAWELLRGYLSVVAAANASSDWGLPAADEWECRVGSILEAAQRGSFAEVHAGLHQARAELLGVLPAIAGESYSRAYPDLLKLHMLQELQDAAGLLASTPGGRFSKHQLTKGLRWDERVELVAPLLSSREPLLALRRQLAGLLNDAEGMGRCWLQHAKLCRSTGHHEAAETSVLEAQARNVPGAMLERCRLLWERDKGHRAVMALHQLVTATVEEDPQPDDPAEGHRHAKQVLQLTNWMCAVGQSDKENLRDNFRFAVQLDPKWERPHYDYAAYLDDLYCDARAREGKPSAKAGQDRLGGRARVRSAEEDPTELLCDALRHYGETARLGHKGLLTALPRLLTLYFGFGSRIAAAKSLNQRLRTAQSDVASTMAGLARSIPPYKWLLVLPQLTSRMCHAHPDVQQVMQQLLGLIVDNFPQQALWAMAAVSRSTVRARQEAASAVLLGAKRRTNEAGRRLFDSFVRLMDQLIRTCMWQPPGERRISRCSARKEFPKLLAMLPVEVQVPVQALFTVDLPPSGRLPPGHRPVAEQAAIVGVKDEVAVMHSLMKPKKLTFIGSDGGEYPFLAKPKDDLRKDYRLMELAGTLNALFARTPGARRRGLALRTYAVLPLTDDCGILQWVNNLVPFKFAAEEVLTKDKLYKRSSTPMQIKKMYDAFAGKDRADLLDSVLKLLPPRMNKWMLARFADPGTWLAARLAFTRSNAAWAMVGHVLGLGDRHGENIMIDCLTGETLHVDFGCLFDRGLTLEVPEMVPFRLTQNVVDALGVSGVEGSFRRAAEVTLQVLRANRSTLMTCAETFLHDPLVDWTKGSRGAATAAGSGAAEQENPQAKDALAVMEGRLSGTLLGVLSTPTLPLSCEGQAARLIDEATSHDNLGRMYIWWMPWI